MVVGIDAGERFQGVGMTFAIMSVRRIAGALCIHAQRLIDRCHRRGRLLRVAAHLAQMEPVCRQFAGRAAEPLLRAALRITSHHPHPDCAIEIHFGFGVVAQPRRHCAAVVPNVRLIVDQIDRRVGPFRNQLGKARQRFGVFGLRRGGIADRFLIGGEVRTSFRQRPLVEPNLS